MIIHIAGTPGSGKSYIGNMFKKQKNIKVIDTDDWRDEFYSSKIIKNKKNYLKFIDSKMSNILKNTVINYLLVGVLDDYIKNELVFPDIVVNKKFFLKISAKKLFMQRNIRLLNYLCKNKKKYEYDIQNLKIPDFRSLEEIKEEYAKDILLYKNHNYLLKSGDWIIDFVKNLK